MASLLSGMKAAPPPPAPAEPPELETKTGMGKAWGLMKFLYENDVTRSIGRDVLFFAGAVLVVRLLAVGLAEDPLPGGGPGAAPHLPLAPGK